MQVCHHMQRNSFCAASKACSILYKVVILIHCDLTRHRVAVIFWAILSSLMAFYTVPAVNKTDKTEDRRAVQWTQKAQTADQTWLSYLTNLVSCVQTCSCRHTHTVSLCASVIIYMSVFFSLFRQNCPQRSCVVVVITLPICQSAHSGLGWLNMSEGMNPMRGWLKARFRAKMLQGGRDVQWWAFLYICQCHVGCVNGGAVFSLFHPKHLFQGKHW